MVRHTEGETNDRNPPFELLPTKRMKVECGLNTVRASNVPGRDTRLGTCKLAMPYKLLEGVWLAIHGAVQY